MARVRKAPIPITIVAGPRAAGKTILINRLIADRAFADTAVILNDFGKTELRGAMVETAEDGFIALGSGCVCCAVRGALTDGLENLLRDLDNGRVAAIHRVIVEADESADPAAILAAVERHPYLVLRFVADGVIAVLDAASAEGALVARADTVRQVAMADVIAVFRGAGAPAVTPLLRALNATAEIVDPAAGAPAAFVGHGAFDPAIGDPEAWLATAEGGDPPPLDGEAGRIRSFRVVRERMMPFAALDRFVEYLAVLQAGNLIRVRGVVATGENEAVVVEGMGSFFRPPQMVDLAVAHAVRFAVVARDLDGQAFESYLDAFLGEARIDAADAQALTDNPLAVAGFSARSGR